MTISIADVTVTESNAGTVDAVFVVSLSAASALPVTVDYATADDSALAGPDYIPILTATLTFDYDVVQSLLGELDIGMIEDGTAVGMGLATAVKRLHRDLP